MKRSIFALCAVIAVSASAADLPGKAVYDKTKCDMCHGKTGAGNPAMAKVFKVEPAALDLTSAGTKAKKDEDLKTVIAKGQGKMPAYATKLKPEEIDQVVAYIRSLEAPKAK